MNIEKLLESYLLVEGQFDVWLSKNPNENKEQAKKYFDDLTIRYNASLHPSARDLTRLSFEQLETLHKAIEKAREKNLKPLLIQWLTKQIKERNLDFKVIEEDYIPPLQQVVKLNNLDLLNQVDSIEELNKELNKIAPTGTASVVSDTELGKLAEKNGWGLYMPHSTEASCELGKTGGRRDTVWCTTRTEGQNLFLDYSGGIDRDVILFYVIKKGVNAENDPLAKMSVGFINGQPRFNLGDNSITVDANNKNLTENQFKEVVGEQLATELLGLMKQKAKEIGGKHPIKQEFQRLVQDPKAYFAKLDTFAKTEQGEEFKISFIKQSVKYPKVSEEILLSILGTTYENFDDNFAIREAIATNPDTPEKILFILSKDKFKEIRRFVAKNEKTPIDLLKTLAEDETEWVRAGVAQNEKTPIDLLKTLTEDDSSLVRAHVAKNENTPSEVLKDLAESYHETVRVAVAQNKKTPAETLLALATKGDEFDYSVQDAAVKNPSLPVSYINQLLSSQRPWLKSGLARNINTPPEALADMAKTGTSTVRLGVAENESTPPEVLSFLAKDYQEEQIRQMVALNPNTKTEDLIILSKDFDSGVRYSAKAELKKRNVTETILHKVLTKLLYL